MQRTSRYSSANSSSFLFDLFDWDTYLLLLVSRLCSKVVCLSSIGVGCFDMHRSSERSLTESERTQASKQTRRNKKKTKGPNETETKAGRCRAVLSSCLGDFLSLELVLLPPSWNARHTSMRVFSVQICLHRLSLFLSPGLLVGIMSHTSKCD